MEAPEYFHGTYYPTGIQQCTPEIRHTNDFIVEDFFNFANDDPVLTTGDGTIDDLTGNSTDSSIIHDSCNSSFSNYDPNNFSNDLRKFPETQFSNDLFVPNEDIAELEWLSNIVEESFSTEDLQKLQLISGMQAITNKDQDPETREFQFQQSEKNSTFLPEISVPGKARSKRNRAAPCNWSSRLVVLSPTTTTTTTTTTTSSSSESETHLKFAGKTLPKKKELVISDHQSDGRKCLHCATDKTPQWRTGPMGPKTLCNACGVRYKSGRLVPEYRPAASPTFVLAQHSNSHRKVLELRRQKEMQSSVHLHHLHHHHQQQYIHQTPMFDDSNCDEYLIHHQVGPDFRQLI